ncbi:di-trans,poly-cis-decaprenylcistransferase [Stagnimonas aquatica]|uniref:Ditrans,polycis-undecaprenyl-diphosphate synthase ((2E,6E)-farnesyl-diphosphate specific) n=1 Tax=Stagnimonas aquatica TaxID=2689987 RepID=A0A3N0VE59_9GAMM|nr:polyprenyl diphosphate synthase [Stagnimonas aquatica]ROH91000.1 di-trans,poly-cis-decaprenylcistransferase [Stagnimonas aquatica]
MTTPGPSIPGRAFDGGDSHRLSPKDPSHPRHVAVIMDGNGRWAKQQMRPRAFGHHAGVRSARRVVRAASAAGVEVLTMFAFSQENWHRPEEEVSLLMRLFVQTLKREIRSLMKNQVRWRFIGEHSAFPAELQQLMRDTEAMSKDNQGLTLLIAVGYGGQWDIAQAAARAAAEGIAVTPQAIEQRLVTAGLPAVDLMVRTGGEIRISNFLLWQLSYAELYFCDTLWPDFGADDLLEAFAWFAGRQRRFGRVPEAS